MEHCNSISFLNFFKIPPKKKTKKPKRTNSTKNLVHADLSLPDDDVINDDYESPDISVNDDSIKFDFADPDYQPGNAMPPPLVGSIKCQDDLLVAALYGRGT